MRVAELWRYPVKTFAGEKLSRARISALGIEGDRVVHVEDEDGHVITSRSHPWDGPAAVCASRTS
jgi:uncharacterized protein YcbX